MKSRPAYRKLLNPAHEYVGNGDGCEWAAADGRPCALPRANRHHKTTEKRAQPSEESQQLRLDIDG